MIGQTISHYQILEELGRGGMGIVYRARDTRLDRDVALKFLPHHLNANDAEKTRFLHEARAAAALNHPNVCSVIDIQEENGQQFIVMEYVDGVTLRSKLPLRDMQQAISYAVQTGEALSEAHEKGIVHRDVKSENIMVTGKNHVKVMDFGLAKLKGSVKLTRASSTVGTLAYMAPEQIQGGEADARSDIFSLGIVVFEMLTGKTPFRGEHDAAMMYSILNEDPESILQHHPDFSSDLDHIIRRALEKDPADRYQHMADMVTELRRLQKQTSRISRPAAVETSRASETSGSVSTRVPDNTVRRKGVYAGLAVFAVILAGVLYYTTTRPSSSFESLAVLPFVNSGGDPSTEYLSDGMTESIINSLTRIPQLRVVPRSTVFRFKGKDDDPQEVGSRLNVSAILTGRVLHRGDELNIQLDLIDVGNQAQVWGKQYRSGVNDVITVQNEIVADVSELLRPSLSGETKESLAKPVTNNPDAYKLYLQGRYFWQKRKGAEIQKAMDFFNQAIALDPKFALAYAGLADSYVLLEQYKGTPWRELAPPAEQAARRALELDPSLGEAHTTLGFIREKEWDWAGAEKEFQTAISLSPNYPTVYHWYSLSLSHQNRMEESFTTIRKALALDPLSPVILINVGILYDRYKDDMKTATEYFRKALELDAAFAPAYHQMARMQIRRGLLEEGLVSIQKSVELSSRASENIANMGYCFGKMGRRQDAIAILNEVRDMYAEQKTPAYNVARVYAGLGERDEVMEWLERACDDHSGWVSWIGFDSEWTEYHGDPRFRDLLKRVGLSEYWTDQAQ